MQYRRWEKAFQRMNKVMDRRAYVPQIVWEVFWDLNIMAFKASVRILILP